MTVLKKKPKSDPAARKIEKKDSQRFPTRVAKPKASLDEKMSQVLPSRTPWPGTTSQDLLESKYAAVSFETEGTKDPDVAAEEPEQSTRESFGVPTASDCSISAYIPRWQYRVETARSAFSPKTEIKSFPMPELGADVFPSEGVESVNGTVSEHSPPQRAHMSYDGNVTPDLEKGPLSQVQYTKLAQSNHTQLYPNPNATTRSDPTVDMPPSLVTSFKGSNSKSQEANQSPSSSSSKSLKSPTSPRSPRSPKNLFGLFSRDDGKPKESSSVKSKPRTFSCYIAASTANDFAAALEECKQMIAESGGKILENIVFPGGFLYQLSAGTTNPLDNGDETKHGGCVTIQEIESPVKFAGAGGRLSVILESPSTQDETLVRDNTRNTPQKLPSGHPHPLRSNPATPKFSSDVPKTPKAAAPSSLLGPTLPRDKKYWTHGIPAVRKDRIKDWVEMQKSKAGDSPESFRGSMAAAASADSWTSQNKGKGKAQAAGYPDEEGQKHLNIQGSRLSRSSDRIPRHSETGEKLVSRFSFTTRDSNSPVGSETHEKRISRSSDGIPRHTETGEKLVSRFSVTTRDSDSFVMSGDEAQHLPLERPAYEDHDDEEEQTWV